MAVAETGFAVNDDNGQILGKGEVLMTVVHDDHVGAAVDSKPGAFASVPCDDYWRGMGEKYGFVADIDGTIALSRPRSAREVTP